MPDPLWRRPGRCGGATESTTRTVFTVLSRGEVGYSHGGGICVLSLRETEKENGKGNNTQEHSEKMQAVLTNVCGPP